jgi:polyisoprenoid-binding protein YceI
MPQRSPVISWLAPLPAGRRALDVDRTRVTFTTRHLFGLASVHGSITVTEAGVLVGGAGRVSGVEAVLDAATFRTGHAKRDQDVRGPRFLDVEQFPVVSCRAEHLERHDTGWRVHGLLTVGGRTAPVDLDVHDQGTEPTSTAVVVRARGRVDRYALGITRAKGMAARFLDVEITAAVNLATVEQQAIR